MGGVRIGLLRIHLIQWIGMARYVEMGEGRWKGRREGVFRIPHAFGKSHGGISLEGGDGTAMIVQGC